MILNTPTYNNSFTPTFGYGIPKRNFFDIRDIPKLTCAKCGGQMLSSIEREELLNKTRVGAAFALRNTAIQSHNGSPVFKLLVEFAKKHPRTPLANFVSTNKKMINHLPEEQKAELDEIVEIANTITLKAPQVIKKLHKIKPHLSDADRETLDIMEVYAKKYPKNTFSEIFNKPEVIEYHYKIKTFQKEQYNIQAEMVFNQLAKYTKLLPDDMQNQFAQLNDKAQKIARIADSSDERKLMLLDNLYKDFLENIPDKKTAEKIKKKISEIPLRQNTADRNIAKKLRKKNDISIVSFFVNKITSTFEHIIPDSQNGTRRMYNGIFMCSQCNFDRGDLPYKIFAKYIPDFAGNIQKQMNKIMVFIQNKRLPGCYQTYPLKVKKTLDRVTDSQIKIDIDKYLKKRFKTVQMNLESSKKQKEKCQKDLKDVNIQISKLTQQLQALNRKQETLSKQSRAAAQKYWKTLQNYKLFANAMKKDK